MLDVYLILECNENIMKDMQCKIQQLEQDNVVILIMRMNHRAEIRKVPNEVKPSVAIPMVLIYGSYTAIKLLALN